MIVKKDGRREPYDRSKIKAGLLKACEKRPVSISVIDSALEQIEKRLQELLKREVDSRAVGELVMEELREIDPVAYVRFASVYREFSDVSQFVDTLHSLDSERGALPRESVGKDEH